MKNVFLKFGVLLPAVLMLLIGGQSAQAAITCAGPLSSSSLNFAYVSGTSNTNPNNVMSNVVTITCTRSALSDPTTLAIGADNGLWNTAGNQNNALLAGAAANPLRYDVWRNAACSQSLRDTAATRMQASFVSTTVPSTELLTFKYWGCLINQAVVSYPAGLYTDTINIRLYAGIAGGSPLIAGATGTIQININAPAKCSITGLASANTIVFNYTAFGFANFQFATFNANCTNLLPYTMSLIAGGSQSNGVVGGLKYQLGLSNTQGNASSVGTATLGATGGSLGTKVHYINGVMDAGQAGKTGAVTPQSHTLTITY